MTAYRLNSERKVLRRRKEGIDMTRLQKSRYGALHCFIEDVSAHDRA